MYRTGASSLIDEINEQLNSQIPDCIIVSVGGGGLICGVIEGLIKNGWINKNIKVIAVETVGCDCFNKSTKERKLVTLENITRSAKKKSLNEIIVDLIFSFYFLY